MSMLMISGIVCAIISVIVNIIGTCGYGWYDRDAGDMTAGTLGIGLASFIWYAAIPMALAIGLIHGFSLLMVCLSPRERG